MKKRRMRRLAAFVLALSLSLSPTAMAAKGPDGLVKEGTDYYYYQNGQKMKSWQIINGKKYYFRKDGRMAIGRMKIGKYVHYFNSKGIYRKTLHDAGWETDKKGRRYCDGGDKYLKNCWKYIQGRKYRFNKAGYALTGLQKVGKYTYYFRKKGSMVTEKWVRVNGNRYYFEANGRMAKSTWIDDVYVGEDGKPIQGYVDETRDNPKKTGWVGYGRLWKYYNNGRLVTGWKVIGGKTYYFQSSGYMKLGWYNDGKNYYFLNTTAGRATIGVMATNFMRIDGKVYYFFPKEVKDNKGNTYPKGSMARNVNIRYNDKVYSFNNQGVCEELSGK